MIARFRIFIFVSFFTIFLSLTFNCDRGKTNTYKRIEEYLNTIKIVNTHEHQLNPPKVNKYNFYFVGRYELQQV